MFRVSKPGGLVDSSPLGSGPFILMKFVEGISLGEIADKYNLTRIAFNTNLSFNPNPAINARNIYPSSSIRGTTNFKSLKTQSIRSGLLSTD